jgi:hypothetical protein
VRQELSTWGSNVAAKATETAYGARHHSDTPAVGIGQRETAFGRGPDASSTSEFAADVQPPRWNNSKLQSVDDNGHIMISKAGKLFFYDLESKDVLVLPGQPMDQTDSPGGWSADGHRIAFTGIPKTKPIPSRRSND